MRSFILAFQFLTILPFPKVEIKPTHFGLAMVYCPVVGLFLGGFLYAIHQLIRVFLEHFSPELQAFLILAILTILTRALHLDGFADFTDGFWGGETKEETLRMMKDSNIGAFATVGLILLILGKYLSLAQIVENGSALLIIMVFPMISRWGMVLTCFCTKYPTEKGGLAKAFMESLRWPHILLATLLTLSICFALLGKWAPWIVVCAVIVVTAVRLLASRKIGGITGDVVGATGEFIELIVLIFWAGLPRTG